METCRLSLSRLLQLRKSSSVALKVEIDATRSFVARARQFLDAPMVPHEKALFEWWAMMQHYGAPTRLLDWTASPYVALYFAVAADWKRPGAVWSFDSKEKAGDDLDRVAKLLESETQQTAYFWDTPIETPFCFVVEMGRLHVRIANQQGYFTICGQIPSNHGLLLGQSFGGKRDCRKFIIDARLKPEFLRKLLRMNITPNSLFPGLDGLGRFVNDQIRLDMAFGAPKC
jgi:FRG domain